ncbi:hypothetical protein B0H17DRAFT_1208961 [Mycena rosella]|uniref:DUF5648 domain-containing protein n=1 Tax=Mycena rosella TaxID=1033263 RepID=A0AAD7CZI0_MYCRO|nr:hypothetical protein B0H17DRAFT_1208961 [Mycena rosella]
MNTFACCFIALISVLVAPVSADCAGASQAVPLYRSYSTGVQDHFYTTDITEYNADTAGGAYTAEGVRALVFGTEVPGAVQFIRLWGNTLGDHFYTLNMTEANAAAANGYVIEDKARMYIYPTQLCDSVPFYRMYNAGGGDHFYTTSAAERDNAVPGGWVYESIAGYVFDAPTGGSSTTTENTPVSALPAPSGSSTTNAALTTSTPTVPAPTIPGGGFADSLPSPSAGPASSPTPGSGAAIRVGMPASYVLGLLAVVALL